MGLWETVLELLAEDQRRTSKADALKSQDTKWMLEYLSYEEFSPERPTKLTVAMSLTYCSECCHSNHILVMSFCLPLLIHSCTCTPFILTISCLHKIIFVADSTFSILTYPIRLQKLFRFVSCLTYFIRD